MVAIMDMASNSVEITLILDTVHVNTGAMMCRLWSYTVGVEVGV